VPLYKLVMHFHDRGLGLQNVAAAYEMGISGFDSSIGGIGGCPFAEASTGNVATEDLVKFFAYNNAVTGIDHSRLAETAKFLKDNLG